MTLISLNANRFIKVAVGNLVLALQHVLNNKHSKVQLTSLSNCFNKRHVLGSEDDEGDDDGLV